MQHSEKGREIISTACMKVIKEKIKRVCDHNFGTDEHFSKEVSHVSFRTSMDVNSRKM